MLLQLLSSVFWGTLRAHMTPLLCRRSIGLGFIQSHEVCRRFGAGPRVQRASVERLSSTPHWRNSKESWPNLALWDLPPVRSRANLLLKGFFWTEANLSPGQSPLIRVLHLSTLFLYMTVVSLSSLKSCSAPGPAPRNLGLLRNWRWGGVGRWEEWNRKARTVAVGKSRNRVGKRSLPLFLSGENDEIVHGPQLSLSLCV